MSLKPATAGPDRPTETHQTHSPRRTRRVPRLRSVTEATPHLVRTQPWAPLTGAAGLGLLIVAAMSYFAGPFQRPADLIGGLRAAFAVTALGVCFVLSDPAGDLLEAVPVPAWSVRALRMSLAVPVLALGAAGQLVLAGRAFALDERLQGQGHHTLAWPGLALELVGFSALAYMAGALVDRGRWRDLGGALAAPLGLGLIAALAIIPLGLLPTAYPLGPTRADRSAWVTAEWSWAVVAVVSLLVTGWASRDRWQRLGRRVSRLGTLPLSRDSRRG